MQESRLIEIIPLFGINYLGPVSHFYLSWIPSGCIVVGDLMVTAAFVYWYGRWHCPSTYMYLHYRNGGDGEEPTKWKSSLYLIKNTKCPSVRLHEFQEKTTYQMSSVQTCKNHRDESKPCLIFVCFLWLKERTHHKEVIFRHSGEYLHPATMYHDVFQLSSISLVFSLSSLQIIIRNPVILSPAQIPLAICYRQQTQWLSDFSNYQGERRLWGQNCGLKKKKLIT